MEPIILSICDILILLMVSSKVHADQEEFNWNQTQVKKYPPLYSNQPLGSYYVTTKQTTYWLYAKHFITNLASSRLRWNVQWGVRLINSDMFGSGSAINSTLNGRERKHISICWAKYRSTSWSTLTWIVVPRTKRKFGRNKKSNFKILCLLTWMWCCVSTVAVSYNFSIILSISCVYYVVGNEKDAGARSLCVWRESLCVVSRKRVIKYKFYCSNVVFKDYWCNLHIKCYFSLTCIYLKLFYYKVLFLLSWKFGSNGTYKFTALSDGRRVYGPWNIL